MLLEFGYGKATTCDDGAEATHPPAKWDLSELSNEEVLTMRTIMRKVTSTQRAAD